MAQVIAMSIRVHDMDEGSLSITVGVEGHDFEYTPWWENCGETGETFRCSCGIHTVVAEGRGCWQYGHNEKRETSFDALHAGLLFIGVHEARRSEIGYPAIWDGLEQVALSELQRIDQLFALSA